MIGRLGVFAIISHGIPRAAFFDAFGCWILCRLICRLCVTGIGCRICRRGIWRGIWRWIWRWIWRGIWRGIWRRICSTIRRLARVIRSAFRRAVCLHPHLSFGTMVNGRHRRANRAADRSWHSLTTRRLESGSRSRLGKTSSYRLGKFITGQSACFQLIQSPFS